METCHYLSAAEDLSLRLWNVLQISVTLVHWIPFHNYCFLLGFH